MGLLGRAALTDLELGCRLSSRRPFAIGGVSGSFEEVKLPLGVIKILETNRTYQYHKQHPK